MVSSKHLLYVIGSLVASISALSQKSTEEFSLYAYGKGIGGEKVFYIDGGLYVGNVLTESTSLSHVNFTAPATDIATTASLTVSSATADIVGEYFAVNTNSNDPVTITTSGTTYTTDGYLFFNGVLVHSSPLQSRFYARPSSVGSYQIYWISDSSAVSTTDVPLAIKSNAPATASD